MKSTIARMLDRDSLMFGASVLVLGNLCAQLINLSATPVISRLYSPADIGMLTHMVALVTTAAMVVTLGYENAIVLTKDNATEAHLIVVCSLALIALVPLYLLVAVLLDLGHPGPGHHAYGKAPLAAALVGVVLVAVHKILLYQSTKRKHFSSIANGNVMGQITSAGIKIGSSLLPYSLSFVNLAWGYLGGIFVSILLLSRHRLAHFNWRALISARLSKAFEVAHRYADFPKYHPWAMLLDSVSILLPIFLFPYLYGLETVGYYGLAHAVLAKPVAIISAAVGRVFFQKAAATSEDPAKLVRPFKRATFALILLGFPVFLVLMILGEPIFVFAFGPNWALSGVYSQILAPSLFVSFILPPSNQFIIAFNYLRYKFVMSAILFIGRACAILLPAVVFAAHAGVAIGAYAACGMLINLITIFYCFHLVGKHAASQGGAGGLTAERA